MRRTFAVVSVLAALLGGACGSNENTGSKELLKGVGEEGGEERLGEIKQATPAPTAAPTATPKAAAAATAKPATPAPTPVPQATSFAVAITRDDGFKPGHFRVVKGTTVKVTNQDSVAHTLTSDQAGVFDTGKIAPGATASFVADKVGTWNFSDQERPSFVGSIEVVER